MSYKIFIYDLFQMKNAYEIYELKIHEELRVPDSLGIVWEHHNYMASVSVAEHIIIYRYWVPLML